MDQVQDAAYIIATATSAEDLGAIKGLLREYVTWLSLDLSFQGFEAELASLPGKYAPPTGLLLLARSTRTREPLACIGVRPLPSVGPECCEMKRLFVLPAGRGLGVGHALASRLIFEAKKLGYQIMKLDTLSDRMGSAINLYRKLGFVDCESYYETPLNGSLFLELDMTKVTMQGAF